MELLESLLYMINEMSPYILLGFLIAGIMHAFVPQRIFARHLSGRGWKSVVKAAAVGVPLPLCSCGVLPTAIAMRRNGASKAASTSFLISTPQTGVDSIAATWSLLGPAFALVRPVAALVTAVFGGVAVGKSEEAPADKRMHQGASPQQDCAVNAEPRQSFGAKCLSALRYGYVDLVTSIGGWLVIGLIIAALITVYVPADFFAVLGSNPILSMLAVLVIAIPMYVCATGSIPIALSLMLKGLSPGTALVLLMAGPAANFASFALISREMGRKSALIYLASIVVGAMVFGLAIDYLLPSSWFDIGMVHPHGLCHHTFNIFSTVCSGILVLLLAYALLKPHKHNHINTTTEMTKEYTIKGMNCTHCQASVTKAIEGVQGVEKVEVILHPGKAIVEGQFDDKAVADAVRGAGFDIEV